MNEPMESSDDVARSLARAAAQRPRSTAKRRKKYGWTGPGKDRWDPHPLAEVLQDCVGGSALKSGFQAAVVVVQWPGWVGEDIANNSQATKFQDSVLYVETNSAAWTSQLRLMQTQILQKIAAELGPNIVRSLHITTAGEQPSAPKPQFSAYERRRKYRNRGKKR